LEGSGADPAAAGCRALCSRQSLVTFLALGIHYWLGWSFSRQFLAAGVRILLAATFVIAKLALAGRSDKSPGSTG
jgi:hypothetical protein